MTPKPILTARPFDRLARADPILAIASRRLAIASRSGYKKRTFMPSKRSGRSPPPKYPDREKTIGDFVRSRRRAEHMSQRGLAELAGVGPRVVWELEGGKPTLRMDVVNAVLRVFGKSLGVVEMPRTEVDP